MNSIAKHYCNRNILAFSRCHIGRNTFSNSKNFVNVNSLKTKNFSTATLEKTVNSGKSNVKNLEIKKVEDGWSLRARIGFFSAFLMFGGTATLSYMLVSDEDFLFLCNEQYPFVVSTLGPWIGLPMSGESGQLDEEEYFPRHVSELVGETVSVACKLQSGRIVVFNAPSDASSLEIESLTCKQLGVQSLGGDTIATVSFLESDEGSNLMSKNESELKQAFAIEIEPLPQPGVPKKQLEALLAVYRFNEMEYKTQVQLGKQHNFDTSQYTDALAVIEERKKAVKDMMKTAN